MMVGRIIIAAALASLAGPASATSSLPSVAGSAHFEENRGQIDAQWPMLLRAQRYYAGVAADRIRVELPTLAREASTEPDLPAAIRYQTSSFDLEFVGARGAAALVGENPHAARSHYFGTGTGASTVGVPRFGTLRANEVYPGVDLVYRLDEGDLRFDFELAPGADIDPVTLRFHGVDTLAKADDGGLRLLIGDRVVHQRAPLVYQIVGGKRHKIEAWYEIKDRFSVLFAMADYDRTKPLVVDPTLEYSTYVGGLMDDGLFDVRVTPTGEYVACGDTMSPALATPGSAQTTLAGDTDVFVTKLAADGASVLFTTYFGGSGLDTCNRIALDSDGNIVFTGYTQSADYPTPGGFDTSFAGAMPGSSFPQDGYLTKLGPNGDSIVFSTFLGGLDLAGGPLLGRETVRGLTIDASDAIYVAGNTSAADFPATDVLHGRACGEDDPSGVFAFVSDAFVAKFAADGSLLFATCFGGQARDTGRSVVLTADGKPLMVGHSRSPDFPITPGALDVGSTLPPYYSTTVTVLSADGSAVETSARVGGSSIDFAQEVVLDAAGRPIVAGSSYSSDFPVSADAWQDAIGNVTDPLDFDLNADAVFYRMDSALTTVEAATYLGGEGDDAATDLEVDEFGQVIVLALVEAYDIPTRNALQSQKAGALGTVLEFADVGATTVGVGEYGFRMGNFFLYGRNGANTLYRLPDGEANPELVGQFGSETLDTRAIAVGDINLDGLDDIVTGNFGAENYLYLNDGTGGFQTGVPFGGPGSAITGITIADVDGSGDYDIVQVNANQQNLYYSVSGTTIGPATAFGSGGADSRDAVTLFEVPNVVIETVGSDTLFFHAAIAGSVTTTTRTIPGALLGDLHVSDVNGDGSEDLLIANGAGGALALLFNDASDPFPGAPLAIGASGPAATAVSGAGRVGAATAHADGLRYHRYSEFDGVFTERQFYATDSPIATIDADVLPPFLAVGSALQDQLVPIGRRDLYVAAFDPDATELLFGTYLGGRGDELGLMQGQLAATGDLVFAAKTTSDQFPVVAPLQAGLSGRSDGVIARLAYPVDDDTDGVSDLVDNCLDRSNPSQLDTNGDGFGNACDPDLDDSLLVNVVDLGIFKAAYFSTPGDGNWNPDADFDGDLVVNAVDLGILKLFFFQPPGPSAQ